MSRLTRQKVYELICRERIRDTMIQSLSDALVVPVFPHWYTEVLPRTIARGWVPSLSDLHNPMPGRLKRSRSVFPGIDRGWIGCPDYESIWFLVFFLRDHGLDLAMLLSSVKRLARITRQPEIDLKLVGGTSRLKPTDGRARQKEWCYIRFIDRPPGPVQQPKYQLVLFVTGYGLEVNQVDWLVYEEAGNK